MMKDEKSKGVMGREVPVFFFLLVKREVRVAEK